MVLISKILFFASHHGFYTVILLLVFFGGLSALTKKGWFLVPIIPLAILNGAAGQFIMHGF